MFLFACVSSPTGTARLLCEQQPVSRTIEEESCFPCWLSTILWYTMAQYSSDRAMNVPNIVKPNLLQDLSVPFFGISIGNRFESGCLDWHDSAQVTKTCQSHILVPLRLRLRLRRRLLLLLRLLLVLALASLLQPMTVTNSSASHYYWQLACIENVVDGSLDKFGADVARLISIPFPSVLMPTNQELHGWHQQG